MFIESITVRGRSTLGICAILAGILRAITSFIPEATPKVFLIYLAVDLFLVFGVIGLYGFVVRAPKLVPLLGSALMILALVALIDAIWAWLQPTPMQEQQRPFPLDSICLQFTCCRRVCCRVGFPLRG
jgi:hypothetical protein